MTKPHVPPSPVAAAASAERPARETGGPEALPGSGAKRAPGTRRKPNVFEVVERRRIVLGLLANNVPHAMAKEMLGRQFGMSRAAAMHLLEKVQNELIDADRESLPLVKAKQVNRLHSHIVDARRDKSWNAVASLERLLSQVQGTLEPMQLRVNVDVQVRDAVAGFLQSLSRAQLDALLTEGELVGPPTIVSPAAESLDAPDQSAAE